MFDLNLRVGFLLLAGQVGLREWPAEEEAAPAASVGSVDQIARDEASADSRAVQQVEALKVARTVGPGSVKESRSLGRVTTGDQAVVSVSVPA